jgi:hypothetical protein
LRRNWKVKRIKKGINNNMGKKKQNTPSKKPTLFSLEAGAKKLKKSVSELIEATIKYDINIVAIVSERPRKVAFLNWNKLRIFTADPSAKISVGELGVLYNDYDCRGGMPSPTTSYLSDDDKIISISIEGLRITEWELNRLKEAIKRNKLPKIKKGILKKGSKEDYVAKEKLIPFIKQDIKYLKSPEGGELKGGTLVNRVTENIYKKFEKEYGDKAKYKLGTVKNLISEINTEKL